MSSNQKQAAFTLIELSITMAIIGLIIGVVVAGKALIAQAEMRAAATQLQQFETAYNTFRLKYNCIIGDCPNATTYFGVNYVVVGSGCPPSGGAGNGNGNGDGFIDKSSGTMAGTWFCEPVQAIESLKRTNFLPKALKSMCGAYYFLGINNSCAVFYKDDIYQATPAAYANAITWARYSANGNWLNAPALSPVQAASIDQKIDDGIANKGKFRGLDASDGVNPANIVGSCHVSGVYNLNEDYTCRSLYYFK